MAPAGRPARPSPRGHALGILRGVGSDRARASGQAGGAGPRRPKLRVRSSASRSAAGVGGRRCWSLAESPPPPPLLPLRPGRVWDCHRRGPGDMGVRVETIAPGDGERASGRAGEGRGGRGRRLRSPHGPRKGGRGVRRTAPALPHGLLSPLSFSPPPQGGPSRSAGRPAWCTTRVSRGGGASSSALGGASRGAAAPPAGPGGGERLASPQLSLLSPSLPPPPRAEMSPATGDPPRSSPSRGTRLAEPPWPRPWCARGRGGPAWHPGTDGSGPHALRAGGGAAWAVARAPLQEAEPPPPTEPRTLRVSRPRSPAGSLLCGPGCVCGCSAGFSRGGVQETVSQGRRGACLVVHLARNLAAPGGLVAELGWGVCFLFSSAPCGLLLKQG